jgi:hypothetical protein
MISTIHDATTVNTGRNDSKTNMEIKKPYTDAQYNKFYEWHRLGRSVPQLLLSSEENFKIVEKGHTVSARLCTSMHFLCTGH